MRIKSLVQFLIFTSPSIFKSTVSTSETLKDFTSVRALDWLKFGTADKMQKTIAKGILSGFLFGIFSIGCGQIKMELGSKFNQSRYWVEELIILLHAASVSKFKENLKF